MNRILAWHLNVIVVNSSVPKSSSYISFVCAGLSVFFSLRQLSLLEGSIGKSGYSFSAGLQSFSKVY